MSLYGMPQMIANQPVWTGFGQFQSGLERGLGEGMKAQQAHAAVLQNRLAQQKLKFQPELMKAQMAHLMQPTGSADYSLVGNPVTGQWQMYSKRYGHLVPLTMGAAPGSQQPFQPGVPPVGAGLPPPQMQPVGTGGPSAAATEQSALSQALTPTATGLGATIGAAGHPAQSLALDPMSTRYARAATLTQPGQPSRAVVSPTSTALSRQIQREAAQGGIQAMKDDVNAAFSPYQQSFGMSNVTFNKDAAKYDMLPPGPAKDALGKKISDFVSMYLNLPEISAMAARGVTGGVPAESTIREFQRTYGRHLPSFHLMYVPKALNADINKKTFGIQQKILKAEVDAQQRATMVHPPSEMQQAGTGTQAMGTPPTTQAAYQQWFMRQPKSVQDQLIGEAQ